MSQQKSDYDYDVVVVGAGVNGSGIALDAAGRGLKVLLCDKGDLASGTSSKSSKLIHGGLRYLEHYEFALVREALNEREILLNKAPHIIKPLRFRLPHKQHLRPMWLLRIGLWIYDHLSRQRRLAKSVFTRFDETDKLRAEAVKGFEYSDAWVDDSRLVTLNTVAAKTLGCDISLYTECTAARRVSEHWLVQLRAAKTNTTRAVSARVLVNAAGPWVDQFLRQALQQQAVKSLRLVKGSHIVVPKIHDHDKAYLLQNEDGRVVFVLPYDDDFSLIGTTEEPLNDSLDSPSMQNSERDYLLGVLNDNFQLTLSPADIVHSFSGVRPLFEDSASKASAVSREYQLDLDTANNKAPLLTVYGGKITTYRSLAEAAVFMLHAFFPQMGAAWTAKAPIAGGDFDHLSSLIADLVVQFSFLPKALLTRYARYYGSLTYRLLSAVTCLDDMGHHFGCHLYQREVEYWLDVEFASTLEDVLWRRSKLGLYAQQIDIAALSLFISEYKAQRV